MSTTIALLVGTLLGYGVSIFQTFLANRATYRTKKLDIVLSKRIEAYNAYAESFAKDTHTSNLFSFYGHHCVASFLAGDSVRNLLDEMWSLVQNHAGLADQSAIREAYFQCLDCMERLSVEMRKEIGSKSF